VVGSADAPRLVLVSATALVSGAEYVLLGLAGAARDAGWDVLAASPRGPLVKALDDRKIAHHEIPDLKLARRPRPLAALAAPLQAVRAARVLRRLTRGADVVVGNLLLTLPAIRLARPDGKVVWYAHEFLSPPRVAVARWCAPRVHVAVCVSDAVARSIAPSGIPRQVIRNGTRWPVEPARPSRDPVVIGQCARLIPYKGQDVFLESVAQLDRADVVVELVGGFFPRDRKYAAAVSERAARSDLAGRVHMLGEVDDPFERMRRWTVAVLPTTEPDPAPLAVTEAMSIGVPVVTTGHGGSPEVLDGAGLLVPPRDPGALTDAIERLLDDAALHARCAQAGPRIVAESFTFERQYEAIFELFDELRLGR
jgi:glycosyltransferase involved in cell wall biosynthesis